MLDATPRLIRATWDWGGGDFETALGGAAHMGRRDIAALLLDRGAPLDLFAAAMLGELAIVRAALEARPALARVPGPHGIPLIAHAKAGGPAAVSVLDYVSTVLAQLENRK
jgi:ankyrin repeat protein